MAKRKHRVGELALFQLCNQLHDILRGKLAGVVLKHGPRGLGRRRVKQHDRRHILPERLCDVGELLSQHPLADAGVASRKAELDELIRPPSQGCTVIKDSESIGA